MAESHTESAQVLLLDFPAEGRQQVPQLSGFWGTCHLCLCIQPCPICASSPDGRATHRRGHLLYLGCSSELASWIKEYPSPMPSDEHPLLSFWTSAFFGVSESRNSQHGPKPLFLVPPLETCQSSMCQCPSTVPSVQVVGQEVMSPGTESGRVQFSSELYLLRAVLGGSLFFSKAQAPLQ